MATQNVVSDEITLTTERPTFTATSFVDKIVTSSITALNAAEVLDNSPGANSYAYIDTNGKGTLTIQVSGTWSMATGGIRLQATLDNTNWITLYNPFSMLHVDNMDFDGEIHSGRVGMWQTIVTGYSAIRMIAVGTTWSGIANITLNTSSNVKAYFANAAGLPSTRNLSLDGTGTGTVNVINDYSGAATDFYYQPPVNTKFYVNKVTVQISDNAKFNQSGFGGLAALTNGVTFYINDKGVEIPLLSGLAFKTNKDWFTMTPDIKLTNFDGLADTLAISFDIYDVYQIPLILVGNHNTKLIARVHDNFTGLLDHRYVLHGRLV